MPYTLITLLAALVLDLAFGEPPNALHPVAWMGRFVGAAWRFRPTQGKLRQFAYGAGLVMLGTALFSLPWALALRAHIPLWWLWSVPLLKLTFSVRALKRAGTEIQKALERKDTEEARRLLPFHLVSRNTAGLAPPLAASAVVESLAENITDGLTAPLFYFALFGLPGAWAYRFCNTCDSMLGYRDPEHEYSGKFAAWLDTALNWLPARLTGMAVAPAAALAGENAGNAWRTMRAQHGRTASPNAGWTMSAMAGALGVTLEKLGSYRLEGGAGHPDTQAIKRCLRVVGWAELLVICLTALIIGVIHVCGAK